MSISYLTEWKDKVSTLTVIVMVSYPTVRWTGGPDCIIVPTSFAAHLRGTPRSSS
jgi:hypothetical protein